eukprot:PRCOL_00002624-RA
MVVVADSAAAAEPLEVLRPDELDPTETQEEEQDATADGESPRPQAPAARENGGSSAGEGPSGRGGGGGGKSHSKIFVGGLTSQQDEASMKAFFEQFGKVSEVLVMRDVTTQRPRGFGFVTFESDAGFQSALATRFHVIDGKQVEVKPAVPRSEMAASESRQRWPNGSGPAGGGGRGSGKQRSSRDKSSHQGAQKLMHAGVGPVYYFHALTGMWTWERPQELTAGE